MCGIGGVIGGGGDLAAIAGAMGRQLAHRGPDDSGSWNGEGVSLVHRRLSIIDTSAAGRQPMFSASGRYVIVYNGELYNYLELKQELKQQGHLFSTESDTEVLLAAYSLLHADALPKLNGMWAFAIWDTVERSLFACRDRFGKKPFYYAHIGSQLAFASEIKALIGSGLVSARPNPSAVADFCAERVSDHTTGTFFQGIHQLAPGSWMCWKGGKVTTGRYWRLPEGDGPSYTPEDVLGLLDDAVRLRLRSDVPVGILLSGGLDSAGVACLAARHHAGSLAAFSTVYNPPLEEAKGIDLVVSRCKTLDLHLDQPDARSLLDEIQACVWHQEEPFADGSMLAHFRLMRFARERGVRVLLTGQGADEVFAGYPSYLPIYLATLVASGKWAAAREFYQNVRIRGQELSIRSALGYSLPHLVAFRLRARRVRSDVDWLAGEYREVSDDVRRGYTFAADEDGLNQALVESILRRTLPSFLHYEDRNSMAFGVETRLPYLDYRLVEAVLPIPASTKLRNGLTKAVLRDALVSVVPEPIIQRTAKQGYPAPLFDMLLGAGIPQREQWLERVSACPLIDFDRWNRRFRDFLQGSSAELPHVWRGVILALWYERFCGPGA